jgi:hypothetical protein
MDPSYGGFTAQELRESVHSRGRAVRALPDLLDAIDTLERKLIAASAVVQAAQELWDAPHIVNLGPLFWAVEHPLSCADMVRCKWNKAMSDLARSSDGPPEEPGAYELVLDKRVSFGVRLAAYTGVRSRERLRQALMEVREGDASPASVDADEAPHA